MTSLSEGERYSAEESYTKLEELQEHMNRSKEAEKSLLEMNLN